MKWIKQNFVFLISCFMLVLGGACIDLFMEYKLHILDEFLFLCLYYGIFVAIVIVSVALRSYQTKLSDIAVSLFPVTTMLFLVCIMLFLYDADFAFQVLIIINLLLSVVVFSACKGIRWIKIISSILGGLCVLPICMLLILSITFSDFGSREMIAEFYSSDSQYNVWIVSSDQGALGGDTFVYLRQVNKDIPLGLAVLEKREVTVYSGGWMEEIEISWQDNDTFLVNGQPYSAAQVLSGKH